MTVDRLDPIRTRVIPELADLRRPRLRADCPILWRDSTTVTLADRATVGDVSVADVSWLESLDGLRTAEQITADLSIDTDTARRLVRAAIGAAALEDAAAVPDSIRWTSTRDRPAAWGRFGAAIDTFGSIAPAFTVLAARAASPIEVVGATPTAHRVRQAVALAGLSLVDRSSARLVLLVEETFPEAMTAPPDIDRPHLPIAVWGHRAVIGPLVDPGRSSCLRCAQLHRRDVDSAWPLVCVQWSQATNRMSCAPIDPLLAGLAAMVATLVARGWIDQPGPEWTDRSVELTLPDGRPTTQRRPGHPLCGCQWATHP